MGSTTEQPTRTRPWAVTLPLAAAVLIALYTVLSTAAYSAYLVAGRHLMIGPSLDGRLTASSLPQVTSGWVPPMDSEYLVDLPLWLRSLCATPTLLLAVILTAAIVLIVVAVRRLSVGTSGPALIRPWNALAVVLVAGGLARGAVDTVAVQFLREQYHPSITFEPVIMAAVYIMPWPTIACGLLAATIAAALRARSARHDTAHTPDPR